MHSSPTTYCPASEELQLPLPTASGTVVWIDSYRDGRAGTSLRYLQRLRSSEIAPNEIAETAERQAYEADLPKHQQVFHKALQTHPWDLLIEAPSGHGHAKAFADVARSVRPEVAEIVFRKTHAVSSGKGKRPSVEQLVAAFEYSPKLDLSRFCQVLIVDDVFAAGRTTAAIVLKLRIAGLNPKAGIFIAAPLRVFPSPPRAKLDLSFTEGQTGKTRP